MRIFYAVGKKPNQSLEDSGIWYSNLYMSLKDLGHDVIEFDFDLEPYYAHADPSIIDNAIFNEANHSILECELTKQIQDANETKKIDLFFSYFYSSFVRPDLIKSMSNMGIPTMNWYCNGAHQFHLVKDIAQAFDFSLVPEKFRLTDYLNAGANPIYCQEAANPLLYHPYDLDFEYDVSFVGSPGATRPNYIHGLVKAGININVWGVHWHKFCPPASSIFPKTRWYASRCKNKLLGNKLLPVLPRDICHSPLSDIEMIKMYSRSRISLGFTVTNTLNSEDIIKQVRLREFEATMSGAFYMLEYVEEIEDFFNVGKEIICFHNSHDLISKINYFLKHPEERENIRQAGYIRATKNHTWQKRFTNSFKIAGLL